MTTAKIKDLTIQEEEINEAEYWADFWDSRVISLTAKVKDAKILFQNTLTTLLFAEEHQNAVIQELKEAKKNQSQSLKYQAKKRRV
jgi:hypothetical protein